MTSYQDLFNLHIKYIEYLLVKSYLSHQYVKNINESGSEVEQEIRVLLRSIIPQRFKVTHGYVVHADSRDQEPKLSPQIDLIIVDTLVAHSIFTIDKENGMEIVPLEAVVGIFEIKRTLNQNHFDKAINHLAKIQTELSISKSNNRRFLPGGVPLGNSDSIDLNGGYYSNPIIGILSATHIDKDVMQIPELEKIDDSTYWLDVIISFQGLIHMLSLKDSNLVLVETCRDSKKQYDYTRRIKNETQSMAKIIAMGMGHVLAYVQNTGGRQIDVAKYFLNRNIR